MNVVTGVHRSGTSLVAMLLEGIGADFGSHHEFYAADRWNEEGYFERRDVMDLNSRLITGLPRSRPGIRSAMSKVVYLSTPPMSAVVRRGKAHLKDIAAMGDSLEGIFVKDPRFCITLPLWKEVGTVSAVVVALRHPALVAHSLHRRQRIPRRVGLRFWEYHTSHLLAAAGPEAVFIDHAILASPSPERELKKLANLAGFAGSSGEMRRRYEAVFSPELIHSHHPEQIKLPASTAELWAKCQERLDIPGD